MVCAAQLFLPKRAKRAGCGRGRTPAGLELSAVVSWPGSRGGVPPRRAHRTRWGASPAKCGVFPQKSRGDAAGLAGGGGLDQRIPGTEWPGAAVAGASRSWKTAQPDAAHLIILLTDAGWFAGDRRAGRAAAGRRRGADAARVRAQRDCSPPNNRRPGNRRNGRLERPPHDALPRGGTAARRVRRLPCPADDVPATQVVVAARRDSQAPFGHRRSS